MNAPAAPAFTPGLFGRWHTEDPAKLGVDVGTYKQTLLSSYNNSNAPYSLTDGSAQKANEYLRATPHRMQLGRLHLKTQAPLPARHLFIFWIPPIQPKFSVL